MNRVSVITTLFNLSFTILIGWYLNVPIDLVFHSTHAFMLVVLSACRYLLRDNRFGGVFCSVVYLIIAISAYFLGSQ
jgi:hypothetical protein